MRLGVVVDEEVDINEDTRIDVGMKALDREASRAMRHAWRGRRCCAQIWPAYVREGGVGPLQPSLLRSIIQQYIHTPQLVSCAVSLLCAVPTKLRLCHQASPHQGCLKCFRVEISAMSRSEHIAAFTVLQRRTSEEYRQQLILLYLVLRPI